MTLPNSITNVEVALFSGCQNLTSIIIPNTVTSISSNVFFDCPSLVSVTIPNSVTSIGSSAFQESGLTSIVIPSSVTSIGGNALAFCRSLTSVTIPSSISIIEGGLLWGCTGLTSLTVKSIVPPACAWNNCFTDVDHSIPLYVPGESVEAYRTAEYWRDFTNIQAIQESTPTALEQVPDDAQISSERLRDGKYLRDGQYYIVRDGRSYMIHGMRVE